MKRPAVFLDRDNTIIHNDGDLGDPEEVKLIQGVASAIASVCGLGYKVVVVTNQGGVARGKYGEEDVDAVHDRIEEVIRERANGARIDAFYFCPFHPQGTVARYKKEHPTRKPKPGMLLQAAEDLDLDLSQSWMVGDALRDIEAGAAAGCRTVLLQADWTNTSLADLRKREAAKAGKKTTGRGKKKVEPDFVAKGLVEAVRIIASQRKPEASEEISRTRIAGKRWDAEAMAKLQQPRAKTPSAEPESADPPAKESEPADPASPSAEAESSESPKVEMVSQVEASSTSSTSSQPARPFVPWTKQAPPEELTEAEPSAEADAPSGTASQETTGADDKEASASPSTSASPEPDESPATPDPEPAQPTAPANPEAMTALNKTMRLVLQELRMQRGTSGEFQQLGVVAIVIQAVAFICMLGALWMGGGDGAFLRWISVAIILQLAVIATLLFSKPSG
ncbi:D-glycero-alpha-D-manno-heptose-1,7-bisphosphate 7-phosphatase [Algisphaera agarilytica]|uniref:D,D-heptose 1,7-bisphosphate phosphatase n=1 Tax=Algisphaera agarilytica TaxID=1385975 RepID=A0A7X0H891_9BACT|nr:HAD family hydrolase [Algisphaera agarilytica]MBB6430933.1 D-glycero-D-manno-heptose 1,7-bisphosphate phosphatase [Algisphaera agarilytica]